MVITPAVEDQAPPEPFGFLLGEIEPRPPEAKPIAAEPDLFAGAPPLRMPQMPAVQLESTVPPRAGMRQLRFNLTDSPLAPLRSCDVLPLQRGPVYRSTAKLCLTPLDADSVSSSALPRLAAPNRSDVQASGGPALDVVEPNRKVQPVTPRPIPPFMATAEPYGAAPPHSPDLRFPLFEAAPASTDHLFAAEDGIKEEVTASPDVWPPAAEPERSKSEKRKPPANSVNVGTRGPVKRRHESCQGGTASGVSTWQRRSGRPHASVALAGDRSRSPGGRRLHHLFPARELQFAVEKRCEPGNGARQGDSGCERCNAKTSVAGDLTWHSTVTHGCGQTTDQRSSLRRGAAIYKLCNRRNRPR